MKIFFGKGIRFLIRKFKYVFMRFSKNYLRWSPPFDYVQNITEYNVHSYLNKNKSEIKSWCIVGANTGHEIPRICKNYPEVKIIAFECSKRYVDKLERKFKNNDKVVVVKKAVSSNNGTMTFFETSLSGSGSLLKLGKLHKEYCGSEQKESFEVETITLDSYFKNEGVDILQIDVQGAEKLVLEGGTNTLKNTKAVFIETSAKPDLYENSVTFDELVNILNKSGFTLALLGTDFKLIGNALFIRT